MKTGTILFTYHRSEHTRKVIEGLSQNDVLPEKLYIFQDGLKESTNYDEWKKANELINNIDWCRTEVHVSEKNLGLAKSITSGISYVLGECDAVIVLEDDCVPYKQFMRFMMSALNFYKDEEKVYSVSGYAWDVNLLKKSEDAYFNGKSSSWGWGTWKERWSQYEEDYHILDRIKKDPEADRRLQIWGKSMEDMLIGNVKGQCDSWAVFWGLKIIEKGGYCLSPYEQLVHNIGFDGSGTHCGKRQENSVKQMGGHKRIFQLPKNIESTKECEDEFQFLFGGKQILEKSLLYQDVLMQWIQMKQQCREIRIPDGWGDIAVWGRGRILDYLLEELKGRVSIKRIIESRPTERQYKDIPIISISELPYDIKNVIVIPYFDLDIIETKAARLRDDIHLLGINELF